MITMIEFLRNIIGREVSDIHICSGRAPYVRINGQLVNTEFDMLRPDEVKRLIYSILNKEQAAQLEAKKELDLAYMLPDICRLRFSIYVQRNSLAVAIRLIPLRVDSFENLNIPPILKDYVDASRGLFLISGPKGSGKTTTLAALIDYINSTRTTHIMTLEDPIEFFHRTKKSVINQREIGTDTFSYKDAIRHIMRQDVDVCLIGELRDADSAHAALALAESGMWVFSTLQSTSADKAVSRLIDLFEPSYHYQVRIQLAVSLKAVIAQNLLKRKDGKGRILACEILKMTDAAINLIRNNEIKQLGYLMQTGREYGMQTMQQSILDLYNRDLISGEEVKR